jgi:hypothetical protein
MMLRQALVSLGPRTLLSVAVVGGVALAAGALLMERAPQSGYYQLTLTAPVQPNSFYVSVWAEGDVIVDHDGHDGRPIVFTRRAEERDGCTWQGTERLIPLSDVTYHYSYEEQILSCRPGATPYRKTPRVGLVTVEKVQGAATLTELTGVQGPADIWSIVSGNDIESDDDAEIVELRAAVDEAMAEAEEAVKDAEEAADEASEAIETLSAHTLVDDDCDENP